MLKKKKKRKKGGVGRGVAWKFRHNICITVTASGGKNNLDFGSKLDV